MKPKNNALAAVCLFIILAGNAFAQNPHDPRKPIIYGICEKPFPAIFSLDYPLCRATAWLAALGRASQTISENLARKFIEPGISASLARMALSSFICSIESVTPDGAPGNKIRVFLKWPLDPGQAAEAISPASWTFKLEMAIIQDAVQTVKRIRALWPDSAAPNPEGYARLEKLVTILNDLWRANEFIVNRSRYNWLAAFPQKETAPGIALAKGALDPVSNLQGLDHSLREFGRLEVEEPDSRALWNWLACHALYLRGVAHAGHNQPGLAEADFNAALARLSKLGAPQELRVDIHLASAELHRKRHETEKMCADYIAACAAGSCEALSLARRRGECGRSTQ